MPFNSGVFFKKNPTLLKVTELSVLPKSFVLINFNAKKRPGKECWGSVTLKAVIVTLVGLNFEGQLSYSLLQSQQFSVTCFPISPVEVLGCAACSSMAVTLGLAEVCC